MRTIILWLALTQIVVGQVPYERIHRAESEPGNWLTYSGNYQGTRHSSFSIEADQHGQRFRPQSRVGLPEP